MIIMARVWEPHQSEGMVALQQQQQKCGEDKIFKKNWAAWRGGVFISQCVGRGQQDACQKTLETKAYVVRRGGVSLSVLVLLFLGVCIFLTCDGSSDF